MASCSPRLMNQINKKQNWRDISYRLIYLKTGTDPPKVQSFLPVLFTYSFFFRIISECRIV